MKTIDRDDRSFTFQGDILIHRVDSMPSEAQDAKTDVVAHSETGHHHVATQAKVFTVPDGMELYMQATGQSIDLLHKRPYDTHETIRLLTKPGDVFRIRRQREYTPEGWRRVED